ncbi:MAG: YvcK family protein [Candidatus Melainabacteria bacterium]|nr:YvcK family protein [Candidatus Melainabacteria bacterium]
MASKNSLDRRIKALMLPGLKRWIVFIVFGVGIIIFGVALLLGYHPIFNSVNFVEELFKYVTKVLPYRISGVIAIAAGALFLFWAITKMTQSVLGAYLPDDRESIPDVLFRRRHLARGPRVVVIGGGTGLANLLKGLKAFTNNITAIVTVGDDGGSSGRLREELGVLPPGDIRNCITALADEEKLVTELFRYRFEAGEGLEGHSFGNLFLTALSQITKGDMLEAVRVASRVLNSCGQVLPSTLSNMVLVAELADGQIIRGESRIPAANGRIVRVRCEPESPDATPEAIEAILGAELIVLGPGSLYTSVIPNFLIRGIPEAVRDSQARKIYVCNVMTQQGETTNYSVADHVEALLKHAGAAPQAGYRYINAVLVNDELPTTQTGDEHQGASAPVKYDPDRLRKLSVVPVRRALLSPTLSGHHDPNKLARVIMLWFHRKKRRRPLEKKTSFAQRPETSTGGSRVDARPLPKTGGQNGEDQSASSASSVINTTTTITNKQPINTNPNRRS